MTNEDDNLECTPGARNRTRRPFGILSRDLTQAVVRTGVSAKTLRRWERGLRSILRPRGDLAELMFDRCWSCYLRLYLMSRVEAKLLSSNPAQENSHSLPILRESARPTLILNDSHNATREGDGELIAQELIRGLSLTARYDTHYARQFSNCVAMLIAMRDAGASEVTTRPKTVPNASNSGGKNDDMRSNDNGVHTASGSVE